MGKQIDMYNTFFGDCFIIQNEDSNLMVDFGTHSKTLIPRLYHYTYGYSTKDLLDKIIDDIYIRYQGKKLSILLTHFHTDHINGLINVLNNKNILMKKRFDKIYIPNVWGNPYCIATTILEEMMLLNQLKRTKLPNTKSSLLNLIRFISINPKKTVLLSRKVIFEDDKYIALWPPKTVSKDENNEYKELIDRLNRHGALNELIRLAESLCVFVRNIAELENEAVYQERIRLFSESYDRIYNVITEFIDYNPEQLVSLNKLNHNINIVFHDRSNNVDNVLFTGDAEKAHMKEIENASEPELKLHSHYKYIKIPHHGTKTHYFDFSKYKPEYVLIPSGFVKGETSYGIYSEYGLLNSNHLCSNSNNCECCFNICQAINPNKVCNGKKITVFSKLHKTI